MYDPHTRESRGFAFVTMVRPEDADAAMQVLNSFELHGRAMSVNMVRLFCYTRLRLCACFENA